MRFFPLYCCIATTVLAGCQESAGTAGPTESAEVAVRPSERILRLLSRFEYDNTVRDLLGIESRWGQALPPEDVVGGFDNNARARRVGPLMLDRLQGAADEIAEVVVKELPRHSPCQPQVQGEEACASEFIESVGARAFRRPLLDEDRGRYLALYRKLAAVGGYAEGIKTVLSALLQSPHFLYRTELGVPAGAEYQLSPYEVASELSYLFWGSMPDEPLLRRASQGALATEGEIEAEARRLLASPRSRGQLEHFLGQWLQIDRLAIVPKDEKVYPEFTAEIRQAMRNESGELFDRVVRGGGKLPDLLRAPYSYMTEGLARFYGLPAPGMPRTAAGLGPVDLPANRGGLLAQGAVLSTHGTPHSGSPIHRGKLVRERFLCHELPPPPPGLVVQLPPVDPKLTNRERFAAHATETACSTCHRLMDPIGLGFEHYDGIGRFRDREAGKVVDARGEILSAEAAGPFDGIGELSARLSGSREVHDCFAKKWLRYAYGTEGEMAAVLDGETADRFQRADLVIGALLVQLTQLRRFTHRKPDPDVAPQAPTPPAPMPDPMPPPKMDPDPPSFVADLKRDSDWMTGYCATVTVRNQATQSGDWSVTLSIEGTINNLWNARSLEKGAALIFSGLDYNRKLEAGQSTSFGFCATK